MRFSEKLRIGLGFLRKTDFEKSAISRTLEKCEQENLLENVCLSECVSVIVCAFEGVKTSFWRERTDECV